ncbi:MAG: hypothetical protein IMZ46_18330, partial [Acidobacteria bacterium]|nr:hypothetical protein [Acidobacteriota bacterium]
MLPASPHAPQPSLTKPQKVRLDPYKCRSLLHTGSWTSTDPDRPYARWSPPDNRLHDYSTEDVSSCLAGRRIVLVGDSWMRQLYWAAASRLDRTNAEVAVVEFYLDDDKQTDLSFEYDDVRVDFVWDPWLNSTSFRHQLDEFRRAPQDMTFSNKDKISPGLLVVGAPGLWAARHGGDEYAGLFRAGLEQLMPYMEDDLDATHMAHTRTEHSSTEWLPNQILIAPVPVPDYSRLTPARQEAITPEKIDAMNAYLSRWPPAAQTHMPWVINRMVEGDPDAYAEDGIHVSRAVRDHAVSVLLNSRCNAGLDRKMEVSGPLGCVSYHTAAVQLCVLAACAAVAVLALLKREETALTAAVGELAPLGFAALLSYLAEKTHVTTKASLPQSGAALIILLAGFTLASFASLRPLDAGAAAQPFFPREHTDEWKGLLQAFLLLLSYFDATGGLETYKTLRVVAGAYVFLSAYGHAAYFLSTGDYSPRRAAGVLLRLNLLGWLMSFALDGAWGAYLSAPVISIWFLVTWAVLGFGRRGNDDLGFLLGKIVAAAVVVNGVVLPMELVMYAADLVNYIAWSSLDSWKMNQDLEKDRFMPFVGILAACVAHRAARLRSKAAPAKDGASSLIDGLILKVPSA